MENLINELVKSDQLVSLIKRIILLDGYIQ